MIIVMSDNNRSNGFQHLIKATGFSLSGLKAAWHNEIAFRQEIILSVCILPLGFLLGENNAEKALLMASWIMVLVVELINSAIETLADRISLEPHILSGRAKDLGSAAVFMSLVAAFLVWALIIGSRFQQ